MQLNNKQLRTNRRALKSTLALCNVLLSLAETYPEIEKKQNINLIINNWYLNYSKENKFKDVVETYIIRRGRLSLTGKKTIEHKF